MSYLPPLDRYKETLEIFRTISELSLFDRKLDLSNQYFHHPAKGCQLKKMAIISKYDNKLEHTFQKCLTHDVNVCKCGWQTGDMDGKKGFHYGKSTAEIPYEIRERASNRPRIDWGKGKCSKCTDYAKTKGLCVKHYNQHLRAEKRALRHAHYLPKNS